MNIAFLDATPKWSGGANRILFLAKELSKEGNSVFFVCLPRSKLSDEAKKSGFEVFNIKPLFDIGLISFFRILKFLQTRKIEIVDINSPKFYWLGVYAAKLLGIKIILTRNVPYRKNFIKRIINKHLLYKRCDRIIVLCNYVKKIMEDDFGLKNICVNYDGFWGVVKKMSDDKILEVKRKYSIKEKDFVCAVIGRVEETKGTAVAIESIFEVKKEIPNIKLLVVGTGHNLYVEKLKKIVRNKNLEDNVLFTGFVENVNEIYNIIDMLLHPSFFDSIPICILESFGYAKPVIASAVGGIPEIVEDGVNGFLFPAGDSFALAQKIIQLLKCDYPSMGTKGYEIVLTKFSKENMLNNYKKILLDLTKEKL